MKGLDGTLVILTGGTGLIGTAIARRLDEAGATLAVTSRSRQRVENWTAVSGVDAIGLELDLATAADIEAAAEAVYNAHVPEQQVVLIANASSRDALGPDFENLTHQSFSDLFAVDIAGHFLFARELVERLDDVVRCATFLSSIYGENGVDPSLYPDGTPPTPPHYSATKAAVSGLIKHLAARWGDRGIRVNGVVAGGVRTPDRQTDEFVQRYSKRTMLGRMARPEEIAGAVAYLSSQDASYVTGTCLTVDGGWTGW